MDQSGPGRICRLADAVDQTGRDNKRSGACRRRFAEPCSGTPPDQQRGSPMRRFLTFILAACAALSIPIVVAHGAKPKPKPHAGGMGAIGTSQLPGDWCKI